MKKLIILTLILLCACNGQTQERTTEEQTIVALGDSLTAGLGVAEEESYPAQLQEKLRADGWNCKVINAGVSGETSTGTLARLEWVLSMKPDLLLLETGANDGLRGQSPAQMKKNIGTILQTLQEREIPVILMGMKMPGNLGPFYVRKFDAVYPALAKEYEVTLMPFFLKDVAMKPALNQADQIHPTAEGYSIIVGNVAPYVEEALGR